MLRVLILLMVPIVTGCSAIMAASSSHPPDLSVLQKGTERAAVERSLGKPISFLRKNTGDEATYQFFTNDEANYRRAGVYAVLTGVTLGMSELVTSPMESLQGDRHVIKVIYDRKGYLIKAEHLVNDAPLPKPEHLLGIEEKDQKDA